MRNRTAYRWWKLEQRLARQVERVCDTARNDDDRAKGFKLIRLHAIASQGNGLSDIETYRDHE